MTLTEKLREMYEGICELPMLLKMPVIAGLTLGVSYLAAVSIKSIEDAAFSFHPPAEKVNQRMYDLESALDKSLEKIETCGSDDNPDGHRHAHIIRNDGHIGGECLDSKGSARVLVSDGKVSFSCYGNGCPEEVKVIFHEYVPRFGAPPKVSKTFRRTDFVLTNYELSDAPPGGAFELYAPHPTLDGMAVYGAIGKTSGIQAAVQRARTRLRQL